jgi:hypothetical protein
MLAFTISYLTHICVSARDTCVTCKVYYSTLESCVIPLGQAARYCTSLMSSAAIKSAFSDGGTCLGESGRKLDLSGALAQARWCCNSLLLSSFACLACRTYP